MTCTGFYRVSVDRRSTQLDDLIELGQVTEFYRVFILTFRRFFFPRRSFSFGSGQVFVNDNNNQKKFFIFLFNFFFLCDIGSSLGSGSLLKPDEKNGGFFSFFFLFFSFFFFLMESVSPR